MIPVRQGDGVGLSAAGFSEVREGDGTVLWSQGGAIPDSAIPDSAIHRWKISEVGGSTITDSVGSADGTLSATDFWTSGTWVDGYALAGDGVGNYADTGANDGITGTISLLITAKINSFPSSGFVELASAGYDGSNTAWDLQLSGGNSVLKFGCYDGSQHYAEVPFSNLTTGTTYRIAGRYTGSDWQIYINDTQKDSLADSTGAVTSSANRYLLAHDNNGSVGNYADATIDDPILCNDAVTDQEIADDYNRQPWT